jgi:DNA-binding CsgD family transcriptional regulator
MTVLITAALARVAAVEGETEEALAHCRAILAHWSASQDRHYAVAGLRWSTAYLACHGDATGAHACADALARIAASSAASSGHPDALAALAHAIGECALLQGDADAAAQQLTRAVELHAGLDLPFERAEIRLRAGVALDAAGDREGALAQLTEAYRAARALGARPLAARVTQEVERLGASITEQLGLRAAANADATGLSAREREVLRLVSAGLTNREIAADLVLSCRTVDMHVRNILRKLDCRSRVDAAVRARELDLVG